VGQLTVAFDSLIKCDFVVDATYESDGDPKSSIAGEPLHHMLPVGTMGGFRKSVKSGKLVGLVLTTSGSEPEWPDFLDTANGTFTYFGDNRHPGRDLHDTKQQGNVALQRIFELASLGASRRAEVPLILVFQTGGKGRNFIFRGLAVPGVGISTLQDDLVALWKSQQGLRFQNYRARFTILDTGSIDGSWVRDVFSGTVPISATDPRRPKALATWIELGRYQPLIAPRTAHRTKLEQSPDTPQKRQLVKTILDFCKHDPYSFEVVAAELWRMQSRETAFYELTQRVRDGGRDAVGWISVGPQADPIRLSFALEAKLYSPGNEVGVKETSRLISRIRHREFGVLVTTSSLHYQAYQEIRSDQHPIVVITGRDIAEILLANGIQDSVECTAWLQKIQTK
jgi:hypothetical protein